MQNEVNDGKRFFPLSSWIKNEGIFPTWFYLHKTFFILLFGLKIICAVDCIGGFFVFFILNHEASMRDFFPERLSAFPLGGSCRIFAHGTYKIDGDIR